MKVTKITEIDAVHCIAETDKGEKNLTIEEAKKLMEKPKPKINLSPKSSQKGK